MTRFGRLVLVALVLTVVACQKSPPVKQTGQNILLISIDSLRADHVGAYGYGPPTTPALDAFAQTGAVFTRSYANSPWTLPSHVSMLTGLYPDTHLAVRNDSYLSDRVTTAAEALASAGYDTHAVVCAPFLRSTYNLAQGFKTYDEEIAHTKRPNIRRIKTSETVTDKAVAYLKKRAGSPEPFFLFVHYWDVHYDYNPPKKYVEIFDPDYQGDLDGLNISKRDDLKRGMNERDRRHLLALYDGEIRLTDDHLRRLLAYLDETGMAANTAILITADHGEEFLEHGTVGHTFTCFEELIRVPLIARIPGVTRPGQRIDTPVENVDLFPTMLAVAGASVEKKTQGHNLLPVIRDGIELARDRIFCETRMGRRWGWRKPNGVWRSLLFDDGKKVHSFKESGKKTEFNLYDIDADPGETDDLAAAENGGELLLPRRRELSQTHRAHTGLAERRNIKPDSWRYRRKTKNNEDLDEQLRGLGYVN
ncbi:MAG: sulfatase [Candidatus Lernaella stagnicola]|nr:sulfatase [Candidatus Lernaella stagnicola]